MRMLDFEDAEVAGPQIFLFSLWLEQHKLAIQANLV